jgi:predicted AlkP superfamily phosphohydrolase/phosphomutase
MANRVLIVGIDGGTLDIVEPLVHSGKLPNLAKLMTSGTSGRLTSVFPPITSPAWSAFLTGKNPGKHGVFDFKKSKRGIMEVPVNATDIKTDPLWRLLTRAGKTCCFLNVPMTFPPEPVTGAMVSGIPCPPTPIQTFPAELAHELDALGYRVYTKKSYYQLEKLDFVEDVLETTQRQAKAALYLMRKLNWDLFMVVFMGSDWLQHFFWKYWDPQHPHFSAAEATKYNTIPRFYELIDKIAGELMHEAGEATTTFVVSDHGFGPLHKHVYINNWLMKLHLLRMKRQKVTVRLISALLNRTGLSVEKIANLSMKYVPKPLMQRLPDSLFDDFNAFFAKLSLAPFFNVEDVEWSDTKAYCAGHIGQIWVNLKARNPNGIVKGDEYEPLREHIIARLHELTDPSDGGKVVTDVFRREEVYSGPYTSQGPDILFVMREMRYLAWEGIQHGDSIFVDPDNLSSGSHRLEGMLIAGGHGIMHDRKPLGSNLVDILPTVLHILDVPIPEDTDGRCLTDIFDSSSEFAKRPIRFETQQTSKSVNFEWSPEDKKIVEQKLRDLGYVA